MSTKNRISFLISFVTLWSWAYAYDFKVPNADECEIAYKINKDSTSASITYTTSAHPSSDMKPCNYSAISDTLRIPEVVSYNNKQYDVTCLGRECFSYINKNIHTILPASIDSIYLFRINRINGNIEHFASFGAFYMNNFSSIIINENNPKYATDEGILYSKDMITLYAYPAGRDMDSVYIKEGVVILGHGAMANAKHITYLELPSTMKELGEESLSGIDSLTHLIIKDNIEKIDDWAIDCKNIRHLTIGNGVKSVGIDFLTAKGMDGENKTNIEIFSRAVVPPVIYNWKDGATFLLDVPHDRTILYVPMKAINAYKQAIGWSQFENILPIEPPIVEGVNEATVSWVQNFSATGYVWHLYSDEEHTQSVMTLYFDDRGYLTKLVLGDKPSLPQRMAMAGDESQEKKFAEYYSFTIDNLLPDTKYYYVRQSVSGDDVIDEESGTFTTKSHTPTSVGNSDGKTEDYSTPQKILENGKIHILHNGSKYTLDGKVAE